ncbi:MAG: hypothetical protein AB7O86_14020 [Porticoccaceae bacterium]
MTAQTPPIFLQAGSHPAEGVRRAFGSMMGNRSGIVASGHLAVSEKSGTPNMSVDVAEGQLVLKGSEGTYQGLYLCEARGTTNLAISAADATNPRRDLIVARVRDSAYSGATNTFSLEVVTGTPAGSPSDPSLPSGTCFVLARVQVAASASSITNANITDLRGNYSTAQYGRAAALGGTIPCTSSTRPTSPFVGQPIYETDTKRMAISDGTNWIVPYPLGELARTNRTSNSAAFGTSVTYFDTVTATLLANRKIRVRVAGNILAGTAGQTVSLGVATNAGTILNQAYMYWNNPVAKAMACDAQFNSGAGGSLTYKISAFTDVSTAIIAAGATSYAYIAIYDEGPA